MKLLRNTFLLNVLCACTWQYSLAQIQLLNDEFEDGGTLLNWKNINQEEGWGISQLEQYNINDSVTDALFLLPRTVSWFGEYRGAYLFKYISGDFVLTTEVTVTGRDGVSLPSSSYSLAGIMIREPVENPGGSNQQNYIFMSLGQATGPGNDFEIKNTCHSNSCLDVVPITSNTAQIRLARRGSQVIVLSRFPGQSWVVRNVYDRDGGGQCQSNGSLMCQAPFSDTLQIGFVAYTDWEKVNSYSTDFHNTHTLHPDTLALLPGGDPTPGVAFNPDVRADYKYVRFDSLEVPPAYSGMNFTTLTEPQMLEFLSFESSAHCPDHYLITSDIENTYIHVRANQTIHAENMVQDNSQVTLHAPTEVQLNPGFEISLNSVLEIEMDGCPE